MGSGIPTPLSAMQTVTQLVSIAEVRMVIVGEAIADSSKASIALLKNIHEDLVELARVALNLW